MWPYIGCFAAGMVTAIVIIVAIAAYMIAADAKASEEMNKITGMTEEGYR